MLHLLRKLKTYKKEHIPNYNQVIFGKKSLRIFGPKIWNSLPYHIKSLNYLFSKNATVLIASVNCN